MCCANCCDASEPFAAKPIGLTVVTATPPSDEPEIPVLVEEPRPPRRTGW